MELTSTEDQPSAKDESRRSSKSSVEEKEDDEGDVASSKTVEQFIPLPVIELGDQLPDFVAMTQFGTINFHDLIGGEWSVLVSFKKAFHAVSTTELSALSKLKKHFKARSVKVLAISMDPVSVVESWIEEINAMTKTELTFPIVSDTSGEILHSLAMLDRPQTRVVKSRPVVMHSVFIIDPFKRLRLRYDYPTNVGRNVYEILRALDAAQMSDYFRVALPANWEQGDESMVAPGISKVEHNLYFPNGVTEVTPYFVRTNVEDESSDDDDDEPGNGGS